MHSGKQMNNNIRQTLKENISVVGSLRPGHSRAAGWGTGGDDRAAKKFCSKFYVAQKRNACPKQLVRNDFESDQWVFAHNLEHKRSPSVCGTLVPINTCLSNVLISFRLCKSQRVINSHNCFYSSQYFVHSGRNSRRSLGQRAKCTARVILHIFKNGILGALGC